MTRTYSVTTVGRDYTTSSAQSAASVARNWQQRGLAPVLTVIEDCGDAPLRLTECRVGRNVAETAKRLANTTAA